MKNKFYIIALFFLITTPISLYSQKTRSEQKHIVDSLLATSFQHFLKVDLFKNIETASQALNLSKESDYSYGKARSYFYLGRALSYLGEYNKSLDFLQLSENEPYTQENSDLHSEIYRIRGQIFMYLGLPSASIKEFRRGLNEVMLITETKIKLQLESLAYENLCISYKNAGLDDSMFYYLNKNKDILQNTEIPYAQSNRLNLYTLYGDYYSMKKQYDSASYYFNQSLKVARENNLNYRSWVYRHLADMQNAKGEPDSALLYYHMALENLEETKMKNEFQELYEQISKVYSEKGLKDSAKVYKDKAVTVENELLNAKQDAIEKALNIIIQEEQQAVKNRSQKLLAMWFLGFIAIIVLAGAIWVKYRRSHQKILEEKEKEVKVLESKLNNTILDLTELAKSNDSSFIPNFRERFPEFTKNLLAKHPDLINSEFWFCAMIFLDFSSKEIAQYSFVEHRSIQIRKSRLRKKLNIDSETDLYLYIKSFK